MIFLIDKEEKEHVDKVSICSVTLGVNDCVSYLLYPLCPLRYPIHFMQSFSN